MMQEEEEDDDDYERKKNLMIRRRLSEKALRQPPRRDWLVAAVFGVYMSPVDELILGRHQLQVTYLTDNIQE